ncbi:four helix bundle protein [Candidatus Saccharibacteria bacterium]|nr:four helix bundle protein [Candidatus Saccharibacteria bacterium]
MKTGSYQDLKVWQRGIELVEVVYKITTQLPSDERFALASQLQRSAVSVPSNIAEGYKRHNIKEYIQFYGIAAGSLAELETQLIILGKIYPEVRLSNVLEKTDSLQAMLYVMIRELRKKNSKTPVRGPLHAVS